MTTVRVTRSVRAEPAAVFESLSDVRKLPEVFPLVTGVEVLAGDGRGIGTRLRETRKTGKREMGTELDITMDCRAHALLPRLMNPLLKGLYRKGLVDHAAAVARWCE